MYVSLMTSCAKAILFGVSPRFIPVKFFHSTQKALIIPLGSHEELF